VQFRVKWVAGNACRAAAVAAAFAVAGCAGDVPVPFMDLSLPSIPVIPASSPAANPQNTPQVFPAIAPPADRDDDNPVMNDVERVKLEEQLKRLGTDREARVKQQLERAN
jgi:hypothetical protein